MLQPCTRYWKWNSAATMLAGSLLALAVHRSEAPAQILVGDPFITSYENWIDPLPERGGNWRISLNNPTLMETSGPVPAGSNPPPEEDNGSYAPTLLIQDGFTTPANYDFNARLYTSDDDLFGVVFGYQDANNYFRVGMREQTPGNLGGTSGLSVQKVVGGVATQISPMGTGPGVPVITQAMIDNREPIDVRVAVDGNNYEVFFNGSSITTGSDTDLMPGKIGVQSWAQRNDTGAARHWGTEAETISVTQNSDTLYSATFTQDSLPVRWRYHDMANSNGVRTSTAPEGEDVGNFGVDIDGGWIYQQTNGFEWATTTAPNIDFIGPAVVVDEPGSSDFSNYEMRVRLGATDNDGIGVLVRVQDDDNFYRINFATEGLSATEQRAPQGLSVQKVRNGVWTELFRDDQVSPLFVYENGPGGTTPESGLRMFDLSVGAVGNSLKIQVRDQDGSVITYPLITDASDPLLTGTVGFATWGTDNVYYTNFGGQQGAPLLSTLTAFTDFDVTVDRATGNITLTNNGAAPANIQGVILTSTGGGLNPAEWLSISDNYDEPPGGNGSIDPDDAWTVINSTDFELSEAEQSGGDGGTIAVGQSINFGNAWRKSRIEDVFVQVELADGSLAGTAVAYSGTPISRSDLNGDGVVDAADWPLFFPNLLADLSGMSAVGQALAGDVDGDGDNDVVDFSLFKEDFDAANGAGAFQAMLASVPEPSTLVLLITCAVAALVGRRRRAMRPLSIVASSAVLLSLAAGTATAVPVDLTTYTVEAFPPAAGFPIPEWTITPTTATLNSNADANVLYSPGSALDKRFVGRLTPGSDDDVIGFVLGFEPGDAQIFSSADYLLIDWKGADQTFNFEDGDVFNFHHSATPGGPMPVGLALSRVTGSPSADELWQHAALDENPTGGVAEIARGATLGSAAYDRTGGSHLFDIRYSATNVTVLVDGVEQFNVDGSFPDGRFGLYSAWQGPQPSFSSFEELAIDFAGLSAVVDRSTGEITLRNTGSSQVEFDYYQFDSASNSLNTGGWDSLSDQNFQPVGGGAHEKWQEAGGSSASSLAEAYLAGMSTLAGGAEISIGNAYNNLVNGEDLELSFRLPSGLLLAGDVEYIGTPPIGLAGDFDGNGSVGNSDLTLLLNNWGEPVPPVPAGWTGAPPTPDAIGNDELTALLNTWGDTAAGQGAALGAAAVPEPAALGLALYAAALGAVRRRSAARA